MSEYAPYDVTFMKNGAFRAECLVDGCGWYDDSRIHEVAAQFVRDHMTRVHGYVYVKVYTPEEEEAGINGVCAFCGQSFHVTRMGHRFCSRNCRKRANLWKHKREREAVA